MAFFGIDAPQIEQPEQFGILPAGAAPQAPRGIMDYLRDPYVRAALSGASRGFANAAQSGVRGTGYALAQGFSGAAEGATSWEEQQAKAAAERVNQMAADRRGVTDYRYQLELIAKRKMREEGMDEESAMIAAQQEMANRQYEQRGALADKAYSNDIAKEYLKDQLAKNLITYEQAVKLASEPDIAAAIERAKADVEKDVGIEMKVDKAEDAIAELQGMESDLKMLPSPVGMAVEDIKAYWGAGNPETQAVIGRIKRRSGAMLKYVDRLPGAATDADREIFMASSGILGSTDPKVTPQQKIAAVQDAIAAYRRLIAKYGNKAPGKTAPISGAKPAMRWNPATGRVE